MQYCKDLLPIICKLGLDFVKIKSLKSLRFSFARETDLPKKPKIFGKHQFLNEILSIDFSGLSVNFIIRELKFCKLAQFFFVSVSLMRENLRGLREN